MTLAAAERLPDGRFVAVMGSYIMNSGHMICGQSGVGIALPMHFAPKEMGDSALRLMRQGVSAQMTLPACRYTPKWARSQLSLLGRADAASAHGPSFIWYTESQVADTTVCAANTMMRNLVPQLMSDHLRTTSERDPIKRMLGALEVGMRRRADLRGMHSASIVLAGANEGDEIYVADVNHVESDLVRALGDAPFVPLSQREPRTNEFDSLIPASRATVADDVDELREAMEQVTQGAKDGYPGEWAYLELILAYRTNDHYEAKQKDFSRTYWRLWEYGFRGGDFSLDVEAALSIVSPGQNLFFRGPNWVSGTLVR